MKETITINDFSKHLFWDVDLNSFDLNQYPKQMIEKVLGYGNWTDWVLLKKLYGVEKIKEISLNIRSLDAVTLAFLSTIFNIDKTEFRCYKHKQLFPNCWNS